MILPDGRRPSSEPARDARDRGRNPNSGWNDDYRMDCGHLIAARLGGHGIRRNLGPLYIGPSSGVTRMFEQVVAGVVDRADPTYYASIPVYDSASAVPKGVSLVYAKYMGQAGALSILNIPRRTGKLHD